jgi:threonine dehydratase
MIGLEDIQFASNRISPFIIKTPLERSQTLSNILGANAYLKMEIFQKTGSFKTRGAFNQILQLDDKAKNRGVVAVSGGNESLSNMIGYATLGQA